MLGKINSVTVENEDLPCSIKNTEGLCLLMGIDLEETIENQ